MVFNAYGFSSDIMELGGGWEAEGEDGFPLFFLFVCFLFVLPRLSGSLDWAAIFFFILLSSFFLSCNAKCSWYLIGFEVHRLHHFFPNL